MFQRCLLVLLSGGFYVWCQLKSNKLFAFVYCALMRFNALERFHYKDKTESAGVRLQHFHLKKPSGVTIWKTSEHFFVFGVGCFVIQCGSNGVVSGSNNAV